MFGQPHPSQHAQNVRNSVYTSAARRSWAAPMMCLFVTLAGAGCSSVEVQTPPQTPGTPTQTPTTAPSQKSTADVVADALPAVVLLINERPAKAGAAPVVTYGAGFLAPGGMVITSLHVVDGAGKLSAMLYSPGRMGFSPMDGGLGRFLFENQANLVPAERIAEDGVTDLAVVRVSADTSTLPALVWSNAEVRPGDKVLALGHPQETVWSFSAGVVGALQHGILQHDAVVGPGSSGGPLLNERGEVIGVNVARVVNQPEGLSFARPIGMVASTFSDHRVTAPLDQSSPDKAAISCWRAQQLALPETANCFDWDNEWKLFVKSAEEAERNASSSDQKQKIRSCFLGPASKAGWIAVTREEVIHIFDPTYKAWKNTAKPDKPPAELNPVTPNKAETSASTPSTGEKKAALSSDFLTDFKDPQRLAVRLRNGLRTEAVHMVTPQLAWVVLASRSASGAVDRFTELYSLVQGKWLQRLHPTPEEIASLPSDYPSPPMAFADTFKKNAEWVAKKTTGVDPCPLTAPDDPSAKVGGGSGRAVLRSGWSTE